MTTSTSVMPSTRVANQEPAKPVVDVAPHAVEPKTVAPIKLATPAVASDSERQEALLNAYDELAKAGLGGTLSGGERAEPSRPLACLAQFYQPVLAPQQIVLTPELITILSATIAAIPTKLTREELKQAKEFFGGIVASHTWINGTTCFSPDAPRVRLERRIECVEAAGQALSDLRDKQHPFWSAFAHGAAGLKYDQYGQYGDMDWSASFRWKLALGIAGIPAGLGLGLGVAAAIGAQGSGAPGIVFGALTAAVGAGVAIGHLTANVRAARRFVKRRHGELVETAKRADAAGVLEKLKPRPFEPGTAVPVK